MRANLLSLLEDFARYSADVAIVQQTGYRLETWTYNRLATTAAALRSQLKRQGSGSHDRVLLYAPNSAKWVAAFWACLIRGAAVVPLDASSTPEFVARVVKDANVKFAFTTRSTQPLVPRVPSLCLDDFPAPSPTGGNVPAAETTASEHRFRG